MKSIDHIPSREEFGRPMYILAVSTPYNIKFLGNDCPGCLRRWEYRLTKRGWIDLGESFGLSRLAPILRMWSTYGPHYDDIMDGEYEDCNPEQIDQYDEEGLLYQHICVKKGDGQPYAGPIDMDNLIEDDDEDWWKKGPTESD